MPHILIFFNYYLQTGGANPLVFTFHCPRFSYRPSWADNTTGITNQAGQTGPEHGRQAAGRHLCRIKKGAGFFTKPAPGYCGKIIENSIE